MPGASSDAPAEARVFKISSRVLHVPIWTWVFFVLPGPLTYDLFVQGPDRRHWIWLAAVAGASTWRGILARLPGAEAGPYITRYGVAQPNLPYRVVCYTAAWIVLVVPFILNLIGMATRVLAGANVMKQLYAWLYYPLAMVIVMLMLLDRLPRTRRSTINEPIEKAWFYTTLWVIAPTQLATWAVWRLGRLLGLSVLGLGLVQLAVFLLVASGFLALCINAKLPRTRRNPPLTPDE